MSKDLRVTPDGLRQAADGLNGVIAELQSVGTAADGTIGRGFSELALSGLDMGHEGLTASFNGFCDRWEWGVRTLVQDASEFARRLGLAAGTYEVEDRYVQGKMKAAVGAAMGDPNRPEGDSEKTSWKQTLSDNLVSDVLQPDYSEHSFEQSQTDVEEAWKTGLHDAVSGSPAGWAARLTGHGQELRRHEDEWFGRPGEGDQR